MFGRWVPFGRISEFRAAEIIEAQCVRTAKRHGTVQAIDIRSDAMVGCDGLGGVVTWCGRSSRRCRFRIDELIAAAHDTQQTTVINALIQVGSSSIGVSCRSGTDPRRSLVGPTRSDLATLI